MIHFRRPIGTFAGAAGNGFINEGLYVPSMSVLCWDWPSESPAVGGRGSADVSIYVLRPLAVQAV